MAPAWGRYPGMLGRAAGDPEEHPCRLPAACGQKEKPLRAPPAPGPRALHEKARFACAGPRRSIEGMSPHHGDQRLSGQSQKCRFTKTPTVEVR